MRMLAFFQTLRGKLILTYTLVTVLALLALEITLLLAVFVLTKGMRTDTQAYLSDVIAVLAPQARSYLQPGAQDRAGLQDWLQATYDAGYASLPPQTSFDNPAAPILKTEPMYVISPEETVLAAAPYAAKNLVGRKYTPPANVAHSRDILNQAMQLELTSSRVSAVRPDGNYLMAVPVQQSRGKGPLAGVIIVTVKSPPLMRTAWWPRILEVVPLTGFLLLLTVVPFGALFGFIMSRGLTRRLKALTIAADAWSEGDFSVQPEDRAKDEISYLGMRMRRMAEHIQVLLQTRQQLALLEERNRLARELHDTVKQETFATLMQVRAAKNLLDRDPAAARKNLDEAEEQIKASRQELGMIISELRPAALEGQGLTGALNDYVSTWSQHAHIPADFQVENEGRLPLEIEQALFRVAQEALSNVARHSRASSVSIRLRYHPDQVVLSVADNGVGITDQNTGGFGLRSMHERMDAIHGRLVDQNAPDGGALVMASLPHQQVEQKAHE